MFQSINVQNFSSQGDRPCPWYLSNLALAITRTSQAFDTKSRVKA